MSRYIVALLGLLVVSIALVGFMGDYFNGNDDGDGVEDGVDGGEEDPYSNLPDILTFLTNKSDRFIVDIPDICDGHPFKGENANAPHQGAHVHFDNSPFTGELSRGLGYHQTRLGAGHGGASGLDY